MVRTFLTLAAVLTVTAAQADQKFTVVNKSGFVVVNNCPVPKESNNPPQHNKQVAETYSSIYQRVLAGERVTVVVGSNGVLVPGVAPGTYTCFLFNGKPCWQPAAVNSLPLFTSPFAAPVQDCPDGRCPLQKQVQFKW